MQIPRPNPTAISRPFWDGLRQRIIQIPQCDHCNAWIFYPRRHCTECGSRHLTWRRVSGRATLHSYTFARVATLPAFAELPLQNLAIVTFEEGFNANTALTRINADDIHIGMALEPAFDVIDEQGTTRLLFTLANNNPAR